MTKWREDDAPGNVEAAPTEAGGDWTWIALDPDSKLIVSYLTDGRGTSYGRMFMRDVAGRTQRHSKKLKNHIAAVNLHVLHYNWCRLHEMIRGTPAIEARLAKTLHDVEWIA